MTGNVPFLMKDVVLLAVSIYLLKEDVVRVLKDRAAEHVVRELKTRAAKEAVRVLNARASR